MDPGAETLPGSPLGPAGASGPEASSPATGNGQPATSESARLRCREFGDYEIISEVARGAMGIVYRARQKRLDRVVALKVLLAGEHASDADVRRFTREAQALARLKHPNIVPIHDIGEVAGRHYFTMDFVEGTTLSRVLAERQLTATEALNIIEQIADAVAAAHGRGVIHRDVKPSNIMLDPEGGVHIMDFGLSKSAGVESKHTKDGTTIGTPAYMSPEQAKGDLSRVDERSDVYSMGAVLYEMLAGRPPFGGTNLLEIVLAVINEDPPRLRAVNPAVPRELETVVQKCMEKDPARRCHTAAELRDEVRRYRAGEPIHAQPASLLYLAGKKVRKHWAGLLAAASVGVLVALTVVGLIYFRKLAAERSRDRLRREQMEKEYVEGSKPVWKEQFSSRSLAEGWSPQQFPAETVLDPDTGGERAAASGYSAALSKAVIFGNLRARLDFELAAPPAGALGLGFVGNPGQGEPPLCYFRILPGRLELVAQIEPDLPGGRPPAVVADRRIGPLEPGRRYRATAVRQGMELAFTLEELRRGPDGKESAEELARLCYAHVNLSNWRYRNLRVLVRGAEKELRPLELLAEKQLLPRLASRLFGADSLLYAGDYNGAFDEYRAIQAPGADDLAPQRQAELAMAGYRLGLYHEIKRDPEAARRSYAAARHLAERLPEAQRDEALRRGWAQALLRELAVSGTLLAEGRLRAEDFTRLLPLAAQAGGEFPRDPWSWGLAALIGRLAGAAQAGPALELVRVEEPPPGSLLFARNCAALGSALIAARRYRELPALVARCPEKPLAAALAEAVRRTALLGDDESMNWSYAELKRGTGLFGSGNEFLVKAARETCRSAVAQGKFGLARDILAVSGREGLRDCCREAVVAAVDAANNPRSREEARQLLSFANDAYGADQDAAFRKDLAIWAEKLGRKFYKDGDFEGVSLVAQAYPAEGLLDVYAEAARALADLGDLDRALELLEAARRFFPEQHNRDATEAAVRLGAEFARCRLPGDDKRLIRAGDAWPDPAHADGCLTAMEALTKGGPRKSFAAAGELFAFARFRLGAEPRLAAKAVEVIERDPKAADLSAFLQPLLKAEAAGAGLDPAALAAWRLELAGYCLLAGDVRAAGEAWRRAWEDRERAPAAAARARLRDGLLLALGGFQAARQELKESRELAEKTAGAEAVGLAANGALSPDFAEEDLRKAAAEKGLLSPAEIEVVLAARLKLESSGRDVRKEVRARLEKARQLLGAGKAWPYELVKTELARTAGT